LLAKSRRDVGANLGLRATVSTRENAGVPYEFAGNFHGMVPQPTALDYLRKGLGAAYSFVTRHLTGLPRLFTPIRGASSQNRK